MIRKHTSLSQPDYAKLHRDLRRQLERQAFNAHYACHRCGSHHDLQIHIPNPDPALQHHPGFYRILCKACHKLAHKSSHTHDFP